MAFGKKPSPAIQKMQQQDAALDKRLGRFDAPAKPAAGKKSMPFGKKGKC